jgi:hypothetical protein
MTLRRRFFPSTPVQKAPGQTVNLEVQLRPEAPVIAAPAPAPAPPGDCECDVIGAGWLVSLTAHQADMGGGELPDGRWEISGSPATTGSFSSIWEGVPERFGDWGTPLEGPTFRCVELMLTSERVNAPVIVGVLQGRALCDPKWHLSWDRPSPDSAGQSVNGHVARTAGNMIWVSQYEASPETPLDGQTEVLTATATCGGAEVATLRLEIFPYQP